MPQNLPPPPSEARPVTLTGPYAGAQPVTEMHRFHHPEHFEQQPLLNALAVSGDTKRVKAPSESARGDASLRSSAEPALPEVGDSPSASTAGARQSQ
eukprot:scaffold8080_cov20-Prasinocladus_malaysianus.AAC.2